MTRNPVLLSAIVLLLSTIAVDCSSNLTASSDSPEKLTKFQNDILRTLRTSFAHASIAPQVITGRLLYPIEMRLITRSLLEKLWPYSRGALNKEEILSISQGLQDRGYFLSVVNITRFYTNRHNPPAGGLPQHYEDEIYRLRAQGELTEEVVARGLEDIFQRLPTLESQGRLLRAFVPHVRSVTAWDRSRVVGEIEASAELMESSLHLDNLASYPFSDKMHNYLTLYRF